MLVCPLLASVTGYCFQRKLNICGWVCFPPCCSLAPYSLQVIGDWLIIPFHHCLPSRWHSAETSGLLSRLIPLFSFLKGERFLKLYLCHINRKNAYTLKCAGLIWQCTKMLMCAIKKLSLGHFCAFKFPCMVSHVKIILTSQNKYSLLLHFNTFIYDWYFIIFSFFIVEILIW